MKYWLSARCAECFLFSTGYFTATIDSLLWCGKYFILFYMSYINWKVETQTARRGRDGGILSGARVADQGVDGAFGVYFLNATNTFAYYYQILRPDLRRHLVICWKFAGNCLPIAVSAGPARLKWFMPSLAD